MAENENIKDKEPESSTEVVGVNFREAGKVYYFAPDGVKYDIGDKVIVETARGVEFGTVKLPTKLVPSSEIVAPLKPIMRRATADDIQRNEKNRRLEAEAAEICKKKIENHGLGMDLTGVEYTFDN